MSSTTAAATAPSRGLSDPTWVNILRASIGLVALGCLVLAASGTFFTTITDGGDFRYGADYWYTASGLPITIGGIGWTLSVHRLQHGADGLLGKVGVWANTAALTELFVQLLVSVLVGAELRWGPAYPVSVLVSFVGVSLLVAGSWRTGLLPRWMLGVWPLVWVLGSLASFGPTPLLLVAFGVAFAAVLTRRVGARAV